MDTLESVKIHDMFTDVGTSPRNMEAPVRVTVKADRSILPFRALISVPAKKSDRQREERCGRRQFVI